MERCRCVWVCGCVWCEGGCGVNENGVDVLVYLRRSSEGLGLRGLLVSPGQLEDQKQRSIFPFLSF